MKTYILLLLSFVSLIGFAQANLKSNEAQNAPNNSNQMHNVYDTQNVINQPTHQVGYDNMSAHAQVQDYGSDWTIFIVLGAILALIFFLVINKNTALKLKLKGQILAVSFSIIALLTTIAVFNIVTMNSIGKEIESIAKEDIVMTNYIIEVEKHALKQEIVMQKILTLAHTSVYRNKKEIIENEELFRQLSEEINLNLSEAQQLCYNILEHETNQVQLNEFSFLFQQIKYVIEIHKGFEEHAEAVFSAVNNNRLRELSSLEKGIEKEGAVIAEQTEALLSRIERFTEQSANKALKHEKEALVSNLIISALAIIIGIMLGLMLARKISIQLGGEPQEVEFISKSMGDGDLSFDLNRFSNRTGAIASLVDMTIKIKEVIGVIKTGAGNIASASQQLSSSAQVISTGVNEQAASAEEVSSSMEEMAANILQNTQNASSTRDISGKASNAMEQVAGASNDSMKAVKDIYSKIGVVVEIAEKTDLLAINAAVEAARAGDQGKGFAVVAAEVRKLAERSQLAASAIVELAEKGMQMTEESTGMLKGMVPDIQKTSQLIDEIASASMEQDAGANQINTAIQQLSMVTQQNASASEEMSSSSEEMAAQAEELEEITQMFKLDNENTNGKSKTSKYNYSEKTEIKEPKIGLNGNGTTKFNIDLGDLGADVKGFEQM